MSTSFTQVPPDSTGDKLHMVERINGAHTVLSQVVTLEQAASYTAWANDVAPAASKHMLTLFNAAGSGVIVEVHDLRAILLQIAAVTGAVLRWDVHKCSAASAGTVITPELHDSGSLPALPAGVTVRTNGTVTAGNRLSGYIVSGEEITTAQAPVVRAEGFDLLPQLKNPKVKPIVLREGQGITVQNVTSSTVGTFGLSVTFGVTPTYTAD
jgi:hypothetical protein